MKTLLLNPSTWDLMIAADLNIAVASEPYALAQDAASAIKLFQSVDYYDVTRGVPYWQQILGRWPSIRVMKANFVAAAKTVPGVTAATCYIESIEDRRPKGQVQVTDATGSTTTVGF
jgi:hypothetical protein